MLDFDKKKFCKYIGLTEKCFWWIFGWSEIIFGHKITNEISKLEKILEGARLNLHTCFYKRKIQYFLFNFEISVKAKLKSAIRKEEEKRVNRKHQILQEPGHILNYLSSHNHEKNEAQQQKKQQQQLPMISTKEIEMLQLMKKTFNELKQYDEISIKNVENQLQIKFDKECKSQFFFFPSFGLLKKKRFLFIFLGQ